jgi:RNA polymerase sigma-70 factor (ECF subfamily)
MAMTRLLGPHQENRTCGLLQDARAGSSEALGLLFESCRPYLLLVARQELRAALRPKLDAADLVQETFIEAQRDFAHFRGGTEQQLLGWLRGILRHNLTDITRRFRACCRCLSQEVRLLGPRVVQGRTVCELLIAQELRRAIDNALHRLPPTYQQVFRLHYDERRSFTEIGTTLHRSPEAARKLWVRTLERLRLQLEEYRET